MSMSNSMSHQGKSSQHYQMLFSVSISMTPGLYSVIVKTNTDSQCHHIFVCYNLLALLAFYQTRLQVLQTHLEQDP